MSTDENAKLNALPPYRKEPCRRCGRVWPATVLNIEGHIHHGEPLRCLDTKKCGRSIVRRRNTPRPLPRWLWRR